MQSNINRAGWILTRIQSAVDHITTAVACDEEAVDEALADRTKITTGHFSSLSNVHILHAGAGT